MRHTLALLCLFGFATVAVAQEKDTTKVKTVTKTISKGWDLTTDLWQFADAVPVTASKIDLRLNYRWITASAPANRGDSDDDHILIPKIVWGAAENLELSLDVPLWLDDSFQRPGGADGNYDTNVGLLWRFLEQSGTWQPAMALGAAARIPTGDGSDGVDGEVRLVMTNEYDSGLRSHVNGWLKSANGTNGNGFVQGDRVYGNERDFQYGAVLGVDGPLGDNARWVLDYQWRIGQYEGTGSGSNILEGGAEWVLNDQNKFGVSVQVGLDDNDDTANFGAVFNFSHSIMY